MFSIIRYISLEVCNYMVSEADDNKLFGFNICHS
jgi:hypothetical protein